MAERVGFLACGRASRGSDRPQDAHSLPLPSNPIPIKKKIPPTGDGISFWRREWDSNPRYVAVSLVFKTSSLNRSDISPKIPEYYSMKNLFCQANNKLVQTWSGFARLRASRRGKTLHRSVFRTPPSNPNSRSKKIRTHPKVSPYFWRRERDSHPRRSLSPYTISSRAP